MTNTKKTSNKPGTGIYADVQNLQDISRVILTTLVKRWPDDMPAPTKLNLYVRADHQHLWRVWATHQFKDLDVTVAGVQHYSLSATKNAADMAIAVDSISDLLHGTISHVAVVSDDSDFIAIFAKLAEEVERNPKSDGRVPFLWVFTDRKDTRSLLLEEFFPPDYIHVVDLSPPPYKEEATQEASESGDHEDLEQDDSEETAAEKDRNGQPQVQPARAEQPLTRQALSEQIALQLIKEMPVGKFKSTDCQMTIHTKFPAHPLAKADGPAFGQLFRRDILPLLQRKGVREIGNQRPRQYEMTTEAKRSIAPD